MSEYIIKETEDGNVITVADVQKALLPMIAEIDDLLTKNDITYFLCGGSALGAVRHGGFIPWDDDFDICVLKEDYNRLLDVLKNQLNEDYHFQCFETHKQYNVILPSMKIRKRNTYIQEVNTLLANKCTDGDGIFIDVFVFDHCSSNPIIDLPFRLFNQLLMPVIGLVENVNINPVILKRIYKTNASLYGKINKNSKYLSYDLTWTFMNTLNPHRFLRSDILPTVRMPFEGMMLPVPYNSHEFLSIEISKNYMCYPPIDKQKPKHIVDIDLGD